jgi:hypothetical protein
MLETVNTRDERFVSFKMMDASISMALDCERVKE